MPKVNFRIGHGIGGSGMPRINLFELDMELVMLGCLGTISENWTGRWYRNETVLNNTFCYRH